MPIPSTFKLGKLPPKFDMRIPNLSTYTQELPPPPEYQDWTKGQSQFGMMANDRLGDCTAAGLAHQLSVWSLNVPPVHNLTDDQVVKFYSDTCGYSPLDPASDQGGNMLDILKQWLKTPGLLGGYNLTGFAPFRTTGLNSIKDSIFICGGAYLGINLPKTVLNQGDFWYVPAQGPVGDGAPGTLGGHAVVAVAYNTRHIVFVSWGQLFRMTWDFYTTYCVAPETKILTADLRWVRADSVDIGDKLFGFDEDGPYRKYKSSIVESNEIIRRPCYDLIFNDGTKVRCSSEHQWLHVGSSSGAKWITTEQMRTGPNIGTRVMKPLDVWDIKNDYATGYIAAAFDGEGNLVQRDVSEREAGGVANTSIGFAQKDNAMLEKTKRLLELSGFEPHVNGPQHDVYRLQINKRADVLRLLGSTRPARLLAKFNPDLMGILNGDSSRWVRLMEKVDVGQQPVVALKTSSRTFFAEGLASHNCEECYALVSEEWIDDKSGKSPSGFDMSALKYNMNALSHVI